MKGRKFKIGEHVIYESHSTYIHGYHRESSDLYIVEDANGWLGKCILESEDMIPGNQISANKRYSLAYENELNKVTARVLVRA